MVQIRLNISYANQRFTGVIFCFFFLLFISFSEIANLSFLPSSIILFLPEQTYFFLYWVEDYPSAKMFWSLFSVSLSFFSNFGFSLVSDLLQLSSDSALSYLLGTSCLSWTMPTFSEDFLWASISSGMIFAGLSSLWRDLAFIYFFMSLNIFLHLLNLQLIRNMVTASTKTSHITATW